MKRAEVIRCELYSWGQAIISSVPGAFGSRIRTMFYRIYLKEMGANISIGYGSKIQCPQNVSFGSSVHINDHLLIAANAHDEGAVTIENNVLIGPQCIIHSGNHKFKNKTTLIQKQGHSFGRVVIEEDVWLSARVVVLAGVRIARGTVVAAGAVVTKDTEHYSLVGGIPARIIGRRE